jgi:MFS family permease
METKEKKFTYHWVIVIAVFLMMAATVGIVVNCFSVLAPAMIKDLKYSATQLQLISLVLTFGNLISGVFVGRVMKKIGMRVSLPIYAILLAGGFALRGICTSMLGFCLASVVCGVGLSGISTIPGGVLINNWFTDKKGTATGIAFTGSVAGGLIFVQISKVLVASVGWRQCTLILALISAIILLPTSIFIVREKPQDKGLLPLGAEKISGDAPKAQVTGISQKAYMKTGSFWALAFALFAIGFCNLGMQNNVTICLTSEYGQDAAFAANVFSIVMGVQILGKILLGAIYDKKGVKFGSIYNMILYILVVVTLLASTNATIALVFGALFGLLCSQTTVTPPYLTALIVGRRNYPSIFGMLSLFYGIGCALGPVVAAQVFDKTGSYEPAWIAFAVIAVLSTIASIGASKKHKEYSAMMD